MIRIAVICLALLAAVPASAQRTLTEREARALTCAATMYAGGAELQKVGRIDAATKAALQELALDVLATVPGSRNARTSAMNATIRALTKGKTSRQLLLGYQKIEQRCRDEFLR